MNRKNFFFLVVDDEKDPRLLKNLFTIGQVNVPKEKEPFKKVEFLQILSYSSTNLFKLLFQVSLIMFSFMEKVG